MKNVIKRICAGLLCGVLGVSATACDFFGNEGNGNNSNNNNNAQLKEQIYKDGVHVYDYSATDKYVVQNSQSDYKIVISGDADSSEILARDELAMFFAEATGVNLPVVTDAQITYNKDNKVICLGKNDYYKAALEENANLSTEGKNLEHDGFMIETVGNGIYIFGDYSEAAIFGVYRYLAIEFNYDCYSNIAYNLDTGVENVTLKDFSVLDVPDYTFRSCAYSHITNTTPTEYRMGFGRGEGYSIGANTAHSTFLYLPKETYQSAHSDWYSLDGTQLCYLARGNQEEYEAMLDTWFEIMKEYFKTDDGYFFRIGHADSVTWCNCKACQDSKAKYGADSSSAVLLANRLAERMDEWLKTEEGKPYYRDYRITVLAYGISLAPPAKYNEASGKWEPSAPEMKCHPRVMPWFAPLEINHNYTIFDEENKIYYNYF